MKYFLYKLLGVCLIAAGGAVTAIKQPYAFVITVVCILFGQVLYDKSFSIKEEK